MSRSVFDHHFAGEAKLRKSAVEISSSAFYENVRCHFS